MGSGSKRNELIAELLSVSGLRTWVQVETTRRHRHGVKCFKIYRPKRCEKSSAGHLRHF